MKAIDRLKELREWIDNVAQKPRHHIGLPTGDHANAHSMEPAALADAVNNFNRLFHRIHERLHEPVDEDGPNRVEVAPRNQE